MRLYVNLKLFNVNNVILKHTTMLKYYCLQIVRLSVGDLYKGVKPDSGAKFYSVPVRKYKKLPRNYLPSISDPLPSVTQIKFLLVHF